MTHLLQANHQSLLEAVRIIAAGGVIAFPTDTVYGLACDIRNAAAVQRVYDIKGRPASMPLIAMFAWPEAWAEVATTLSPIASYYMTRWWPGPLTIVAAARPDLPAKVLGDGKTIGMRIPDHPLALELLRRAGRPLATTSANTSGHPAPSTAKEVVTQLGVQLDLILDAGATPGGVASTLVDCSVDPPVILREGPITRADLGIS